MSRQDRKILLVEGVDGAGKSTYVSQIISKYLDHQSDEALSFPSPVLRERLRKGGAVSRMDFLNDFEQTLRKIRRGTELVICDRSFISTAVYQLGSPITMYETIETGLEIFSQHADKIEIRYIATDHNKVCDRLMDRVSLENIESSETLDDMERFVLHCVGEFGLLKGRVGIKDVISIMDKLYMAAIDITLELCSRYGIACSWDVVKL